MSSEVKVGYRAVDGLQIRYADSDGPASQHLVLTSPWPESLHAFDPIWPRLSGIARLLAIDLPGFGRSERRTDLLSPMAMSGFLSRSLMSGTSPIRTWSAPASARQPGCSLRPAIPGGSAAWSSAGGLLPGRCKSTGR